MEPYIITLLVFYLIYREVKYRELVGNYEKLKKGMPELQKQLMDITNQFESFKNSNMEMDKNTQKKSNKNVITDEKRDFEDKMIYLTQTSKSIEQYFFYVRGDTDNYALSLNYSKKSKGTKIICSCRGYERGYICKHIIWLFNNEDRIIFGKENLNILNTFYNKENLLPTLEKLEVIRGKREQAWKKDGNKLYEYFNVEEQENLNLQSIKLIGHQDGTYRTVQN